MAKKSYYIRVSVIEVDGVPAEQGKEISATTAQIMYDHNPKRTEGFARMISFLLTGMRDVVRNEVRSAANYPQVK